MKKFTICVLVLALIQTTSFSQSCLPEGIKFTSQPQIDSFPINYPNCTEIEGYVEILGANITNLNGLNAISSITGGFIIRWTSLPNLAGLNSLESLGDFLVIDFNNSLSSLSGLENLIAVEGSLRIGNWIGDGNDLLTDLSGLDNLSFVGGNLRIFRNTTLSSLAGLENLNTINGYLTIGFDPTSWGHGGNPSLKNIDALTNLSNLSGGLEILFNDSLADLTGLIGLNSVGVNLWIEGNALLTNLDGLENISSIASYLAIRSNPELANIDGIRSIASNSILYLSICNNDLLMNCDVESICDYLESPNGDTEIYDNAPTCNSPEEVEEACDDTYITEGPVLQKILIFPNPARNEITISADDGSEAEEVNIFNLAGQPIMQVRPVEGKIDISGLQQGLYILETIIWNTRLRQKLIVQ